MNRKIPILKLMLRIFFILLLPLTIDFILTYDLYTKPQVFRKENWPLEMLNFLGFLIISPVIVWPALIYEFSESPTLREEFIYSDNVLTFFW